jgi:hypothetical protein
MKSKLLEITKTNDYPDLYNSSEFELKFQAFHDAIFNFATTKFKTKTRLKEIKHEWIRSAFFAKENFTEKEKEKVTIKIITKYSNIYRIFIQYKINDSNKYNLN